GQRDLGNLSHAAAVAGVVGVSSRCPQDTGRNEQDGDGQGNCRNGVEDTHAYTYPPPWLINHHSGPCITKPLKTIPRARRSLTGSVPAMWTTLVVIAIALSIEPVRIGLTVLMLNRPRPMVQLLTFLCGGFAMGFGVNLVVLFVLSRMVVVNP